VQIDVERLVSHPHRATTQFERFSVFTRHQLVVVKSFRWLVRCRFNRSSKVDSPDTAVPGRALRSMHTGQNSIAPENSLPQLGQVRWRSALMGLTVLPRRLKLRKEHGFPRQPAAAQLGNQVHGSEPLAIPSSTERCETRRRPLLASCGAASIVTPVGQTREYHMQSEFGISHF
jgi:hypothetical protein